MKKKKAKKAKTNICSICHGPAGKKSKAKTKCCPVSMVSGKKGSWNM